MKTKQENFESRQIVVGAMIYHNEEYEVEPDEAKEEFDQYVVDRAAGKRRAGPDGLAIRALFLCTRKENGADRLKENTAKLLGLDPKTTYSEALLHCKAVYTRQLEAQKQGVPFSFESHYAAFSA